MAMPQSPVVPDHFHKTDFSELSGWIEDDQLGALNAFLRFCGHSSSDILSGALGYGPSSVANLCKTAQALPIRTAADARRFLESRFTPYRVESSGFVTGYFEPEVPASRTRTDHFATPLHRKPAGLEAVSADNKPKDWPDDLSHGRRQSNTLVKMPDRAAIMDGAIDHEQLELVWLADPIDAYFIHVQGSARLRLTDGSVMRVGYAGKSGHPYTGIGRLLVKRGEGTPEDFTMSGLRTWLSANPHQRDSLFKENRSYIFFREVHETTPKQGPVGAAGLPLVPGRSLAVDHEQLPYGALIFVNAGFESPETGTKSFARLMVADDTGSAIKGPARGDIFVGSGAQAGEIAGDIRHKAAFTILVPNEPAPGRETVTD
ncbi:MltA domain-containing protein [uncultured Roseibium sp.]|uniref:murein transglycosylase A n=1 Tax=uncultured Roseibium sp. TaxID=1936171 RepID=UPI00263998C1|nr:MltA domain-containing protein [uncultured Roseibium sp.]